MRADLLSYAAGSLGDFCELEIALIVSLPSTDKRICELRSLVHEHSWGPGFHGSLNCGFDDAPINVHQISSFDKCRPGIYLGHRPEYLPLISWACPFIGRAYNVHQAISYIELRVDRQYWLSLLRGKDLICECPRCETSQCRGVLLTDASERTFYEHSFSPDGAAVHPEPEEG